METVRGILALGYLVITAYGTVQVWLAEGFAAALVFFVAITILLSLAMALSDAANALINRILGK